jgi:hypothetical protein
MRVPVPQASHRTTLDHAIAAGEAPIEAKAMMKHGEWSPWLLRDTELAPRTVQDYMAVARNRPKYAGTAHLNVTQALVGTRQPTPQSTPPEDYYFVNREVAGYGGGASDRHRHVAGNEFSSRSGPPAVEPDFRIGANAFPR